MRSIPVIDRAHVTDVGALPIPEGETATATVTKTGSEWAIKMGTIDKSGVAYGSFANTLNTTGWGILDVVANGNFADTDMAFAAGYLEGYLSANMIYDTAQNLRNVLFGTDEPSEALKTFLTTQYAWLDAQVSANAGDHYWQQVGNVRAQLNGLIAGYNAQSAFPALAEFDFWMLNGNGDLFTIMSAVDKSKRVDLETMSAAQVQQYVERTGHCSAVVKVNGGLTDILFSHSAWFSYQVMNRIFKHYTLPFANPTTKATKFSFSSYGGYLESLDDFFLADSGLVELQTTNSIFNNTLYDFVVPQSLQAWVRLRVAMSSSASGSEWADVFKRNTCGTYQNQYMIIDMNLFTPGEPLKDNLLWVIEEVPSLLVSGDQTERLRSGYWPSYNRAFYDEIFDISGYPEAVAKHGVYYTYELAPRASIFRQYNGNIRDLDSLKTFMRSNDYESDPFANDGTGQNPMYAICSRGDLLGGSHTTRSTDGCYDTKVSSWAAMQERGTLWAEAVNGPTRSGEKLPIFKWSDHFNTTVHVGQPDAFDFDFIQVQPRTFE